MQTDNHRQSTSNGQGSATAVSPSNSILGAKLSTVNGVLDGVANPGVEGLVCSRCHGVRLCVRARAHLRIVQTGRGRGVVGAFVLVLQGAPAYIYNGERNAHTEHGRVVYYEPRLIRPTATGSAYRYGTHSPYKRYD